jgi:hypothetical protein
MRSALIALLFAGFGFMGAVSAAEPYDVPLDNVLKVASRNAALYSSIRLQLWRANVGRADVVCRGHRFDSTWSQLSGAQFGPYECPIGKRTIFITATQSYYDDRGRKLQAIDPTLPTKAVRIAETNFKWRWREGR